MCLDQHHLHVVIVILNDTLKSKVFTMLSQPLDAYYRIFQSAEEKVDTTSKVGVGSKSK